jgi:hypothetical protein
MGGQVAHLRKMRSAYKILTTKPLEKSPHGGSGWEYNIKGILRRNSGYRC